jgi:N6-adenosine-specific RNA methylase IME4
MSPSSVLFAPLPPGLFACVHADPAIRYRSNSRERPGRNAMAHYRCYSYTDFMALSLADVVAKDAFLFLWIPGPWFVLGAHVPLMRAWGFEPSGIAFTWIKLRRGLASRPNLFFTEADLFMGCGHRTRKNAEFCALGRRGRPERLSKAVREIIIAPVREHSRKPDEVYARMERFCAGPYLDLFARQRRDGWIPYGDQTSRFDFEGPQQRLPLEHAGGI